MKAVIECIAGLWTVTHNGRVLARSKNKRLAVKRALGKAIKMTGGNERVLIVEKETSAE